MVPEGATSKRRGQSPGIFRKKGVLVRELSIFVDESGDKSRHARYFIVTLVLHDQRDFINDCLQAYETVLRDASLPDIAFHSEPLLNGHKEYEGMSLAERKKLLAAFGSFVRHLPVRYASYVYDRRDRGNTVDLSAKLRRDLSGLFFGELDFFQQFDKVKIYYDNGQGVVRRALDDSVNFALSKQAVVQRRTTMAEYRLAQVADYLCAMELAALRYRTGDAGATYEKFFGGIGSFKKNWLKQVRRKRL
ncbi:DUF3800 domain-containing protein [uncultured Adlercreutzia sp.]|uniref:DUF3800 domain-containing protein n=1 Tax=uncultured Adlercreutzia sp. TaxID=875803 RepID=UPI0026F3E9D4|nr:DUF3800 domain-containing protein [uncultured Adlercreutzia sp.]